MIARGVDIVIISLSWALAGILGFAAHRASLCTVRAVAEVMSSRRAYCLTSFAKAVLWVFAIVLPVLAVRPHLADGIAGLPFSWWPVLGGLVFGMGAALNGGCSFSTLSRLADGQLSMLATLLGFVAGVVIEGRILSTVHSSDAPFDAPGILTLAPFAGILSLVIWLWAAHEVFKLWRTRPHHVGMAGLVLARQYRLSTAAAIIGIASAGLYLIYGSWSFMAVLRRSPGMLGVEDWGLVMERMALLAAVIAGMVLSTVQRRSFRLDWRVRRSWFLNLGGGILMGAGAVLVPGGNDALLLYGIPMFSRHALPAYAAMLVGVAMVLVSMRFVVGDPMTIRCDGDICRAD